MINFLSHLENMVTSEFLKQSNPSHPQTNHIRNLVFVSKHRTKVCSFPLNFHLLILRLRPGTKCDSFLPSEKHHETPIIWS